MQILFGNCPANSSTRPGCMLTVKRENQPRAFNLLALSHSKPNTVHVRVSGSSVECFTAMCALTISDEISRFPDAFCFADNLHP